jgi:hypothetical protein
MERDDWEARQKLILKYAKTIFEMLYRSIFLSEKTFIN